MSHDRINSLSIVHSFFFGFSVGDDVVVDGSGFNAINQIDNNAGSADGRILKMNSE